MSHVCISYFKHVRIDPKRVKRLMVTEWKLQFLIKGGYKLETVVENDRKVWYALSSSLLVIIANKKIVVTKYSYNRPFCYWLLFVFYFGKPLILPFLFSFCFILIQRSKGEIHSYFIRLEKIWNVHWMPRLQLSCWA